MQLLQFAKTSDFVKVLNGWLDYVLTMFFPSTLSNSYIQ